MLRVTNRSRLVAPTTTSIRKRVRPLAAALVRLRIQELAVDYIEPFVSHPSPGVCRAATECLFPPGAPKCSITTRSCLQNQRLGFPQRQAGPDPFTGLCRNVKRDAALHVRRVAIHRELREFARVVSKHTRGVVLGVVDLDTVARGVKANSCRGAGLITGRDVVALPLENIRESLVQNQQGERVQSVAVRGRPTV